MVMPLAKHRFTVDEFQRMGSAGVFHEDDRVELLDGEIVEMTPIGSRHAATVDRLAHHLGRRAGQRAIVRVQSPIVLGTTGMPQPDVCLLVPRPDFYQNAHPGAGDVLLVAEVADTSLDAERGRKLPAYAAAGIPEVWLVDLPGDAIEIHRDPRGGHHANVRTACRGETVAPLAFPDLTLQVDEILG